MGHLDVGKTTYPTRASCRSFLVRVWAVRASGMETLLICTTVTEAKGTADAVRGNSLPPPSITPEQDLNSSLCQVALSSAVQFSPAAADDTKRAHRDGRRNRSRGALN